MEKASCSISLDPTVVQRGRAESCPVLDTRPPYGFKAISHKIILRGSARSCLPRTLWSSGRQSFSSTTTGPPPRPYGQPEGHAGSSSPRPYGRSDELQQVVLPCSPVVLPCSLPLDPMAVQGGKALIKACLYSDSPLYSNSLPAGAPRTGVDKRHKWVTGSRVLP